MEKEYKNYLVTRTFLRQTKRVVTMEVLAESKDEAKQKVEASIKEESSYVYDRTPKEEERGDKLISLKEIIEISEVN